MDSEPNLFQHRPDRVQRETGGCDGLFAGLAGEAAVEAVLIGQPADLAERLLARGLSSFVRRKKEASKASGSVRSAGSADQSTGCLRPGLRTISTTSPSTALAVAGPPAPGPKNMALPMLLPSTSMAFSTPETGASGCAPATKCGETNTAICSP